MDDRLVDYSAYSFSFHVTTYQFNAHFGMRDFVFATFRRETRARGMRRSKGECAGVVQWLCLDLMLAQTEPCEALQPVGRPPSPQHSEVVVRNQLHNFSCKCGLHESCGDLC